MKLDLSHKGICSYFSDKDVNYSHELLLLPSNHNLSPKRLSDFSKGRYCANLALEQLDIKDVIIPIGNNREPIWPDGIVGSISHCDILTGAIVGKSAEFISMGLDIEEIGRVTPDLWDLIFTQKEKDFLINLSDRELQEKSTAIFSIKEAYYKFQYPITKTYLDFLDVEVALPDFRQINVLVDSINLSSILSRYEVNYFLEKGCVISFIIGRPENQ